MKTHVTCLTIYNNPLSVTGFMKLNDNNPPALSEPDHNPYGDSWDTAAQNNPGGHSKYVAYRNNPDGDDEDTSN